MKSYVYAFFDKYMGDKQYEGEKKPHNRLFAQYHQVYPESMKKFKVEEICKEHIKSRLIFANVAIGMGLDITKTIIKMVTTYRARGGHTTD